MHYPTEKPSFSYLGNSTGSEVVWNVLVIILQASPPYPTVHREGYLSMASMVPAATAVPITPETFGPMACISRKFDGLAC